MERYAYGERGRRVVFTDGAGNAYAELTSETNRLGDSQTYSYDAEGRRSSTTAYSGKMTRVEHNDVAGTTTTYYTDGTVSRITRDIAGNIIRAEGTSGALIYEYDAGRVLHLREERRAGIGE